MAIRAKNPRKMTAATMRNTIVMKPTHSSWGQYTAATTGARLKPMSMTTAPLTAGGSTFCTTPPPAKCTMTPTTISTAPAMRMEPVTSLELPPWARIAATAATKDAEVPSVVSCK